MPAPFDLLRDPATQVLLAVFAGLALWQTLAPGRVLPIVPGYEHDTGFRHGASARVLDMLLLRDVSRQGGAR